MSDNQNNLGLDPSFWTRMSMSVAIDANPDYEAKLKQLSKDTGVPIESARAYTTEVEREAKLNAIDYQDLHKNFPATAKYFADVENAKLAHDDMGILSSIEAALKPATDTLRAIPGGLQKMSSNLVYGTPRLLAGLGSEYITGPLTNAGVLPEDFLARAEDSFSNWNKQGQSLGDKISGENPQGFVAQGIKSGAESVGRMIPSLAAGLVTGNPWVAIGVGAADQGIQSANQGRDAGLSATQSFNYGLQDATAEAVTEMIPMGRLFKDLKAGAPLWKTIGHQIMTETPTEMVATAWQNFNEWANLHPEQSTSDYLEKLGPDELQTIIATATSSVLTGGFAHGVNKVISRMDNAATKVQEATQTKEKIDAISQVAVQSKLRQRDPEAFQDFVKQAGEEHDITDVYIDANVLNQSGLGEQLAAVSPAVAEQLPIAGQTGGLIRIPIEDYATNIAAEYHQDLSDHLKFNPDGLSPAEAKVYMESHGQELQAEVEKVMHEKAGDTVFKSSMDAVKTNLRDQLNATKRFTDPVNDSYSTLVANYYGVQAAKLGITPEQLYQQYPLKVVGKAIAGDVLHQQSLPKRIASNFREAREFAKEFQGGNLTNLSTGMVATVSRNNLDKMLSAKAVGKSSSPAVQSLAVANIDQLFQNAVLGWSKPDRSGDTNLRAIHRFFAPLNTEDGMRMVKLTVKEFALDDQGNKIYSLEAVDLNEKSPAAQWVDATVKEDISDPTSIRSVGDIHKLAQQIEDFNNLLKQEARGTFSPSSNTIALLKNADLSTFLHETGHFFLETSFDIASQIEDASGKFGESTQTGNEKEILHDAYALLNWFGIKNLSEWHNLPFEEKRTYHEQFARGFESYLYEGKSPSIELNGLFQKFRAWLVNIYKSIKALNVELTDEVRGVMDRMVASNEQIAMAEQARSMMPLFDSADHAGMTQEEFKQYQDMANQSSMDAQQDLQAKGLRDMQWLHNARGREIKKLQALSKEKRAEVQMHVRKQVLSEPIYQAWQFLTGKKSEDGSTGKISTGALESEGVDPDVVSALKSRKMIAKDGIHPEILAERFGLSSGDELVKSLATVTPLKDEIESLTDAMMLQTHGELATPEAIERAADAAIHNEARAKMVATELNALSKATGQRKVLVEVAKEFANQMIARLKVRDIKPQQYANAEARAGKAAQSAIKKGDIQQAATEKRNQLLNTLATKAAYSAREEVEKTVKYLRKFDGASIRDKLPTEYVQQIDMLLSKFSLKDQSLTAIDGTKSLRTWVQGQLNNGVIPNISERLLTADERKAYEAAINSRDEEGNLVYPDDEERIKLLADAIERSVTRSYKDITLEELRGLNDSVKQIEHLARLKNKMLTSKEQKTYEATRDELAAGIINNAKKSGLNTRTPNDLLGKSFEKIKQFGASHIKIATWMRIFDGGDDNGAWFRHVLWPANERASFETGRRAEATQRLMAILGPVLSKVKAMDKIGKGMFIPELGTSLNWEERFAIACNYGNESNLQRLMGGGIAGSKQVLTIEEVHAVLKTLSTEEWRAVQSVWDHFESYRDEIAAKEMRVNGTEPEWIAARPFTVRTADGETITLRGGYYPVVFDPKTSLKAEQHNDSQSAKDAMKAAYSVATTQRSFTKSRVEEVHGRALLLNLRGLFNGTNDVIHDLAWHEWVIDFNKLMRSQQIDEAVRDHYGAEVKREMTKWRDDIVAGTKRLDHGVENAAGWARKFVSSSALTFNVMSAILQPLGITQSISRVGAKWVGVGVQRYLASPIDSTRYAKEKSMFMENRTRTMFRDLNELRNRVAGQTTFGELMGRYGYFLTMHCQMMVDVPTWIGAYEKAIHDGRSEDKAIAIADQSVKDSQGGGEEVDQSGITRGGPLVKLFTAFYDFMNTQLNVLYLKGATAESKADKWMNWALVGVATPIFAAALKDALTPGDSGDWDDWESIMKKMLTEGLSNLIGMVAFGREFTTAAKALIGQDNGMSYTGPTGLRVFGDAAELGKQIHQGELDDAFRKKFINVIGDVSGVPAVQTNRTITGAKAIADGKTSNPTALVFGFQEHH